MLLNVLLSITDKSFLVTASSKPPKWPAVSREIGIIFITLGKVIKINIYCSDITDLDNQIAIKNNIIIKEVLTVNNDCVVKDFIYFKNLKST